MLRNTRKHGRYTQKGGGTWYPLPNSGPISAAIKSTGLSDILNAKTEVDRQKQLYAYINAIANQDELFTAIHDEYVKQSKPADSTSSADWVIEDKEKIDKDTGLKNYIESIAMGALTLTKLPDINTANKLQLIKNGRYAPTSHLVLYPACLQNMVISGIAKLFVALKSDPSTLEAMVREDIKTTKGSARRNTMINMLAAQNVGFIRSLALMMTQKDIEDGLTIMSESINEEQLTNFWNNTLIRIILNYSIDTSKATYDTDKLNLFKTDKDYVIHEREDATTDTTSIEQFGFVAGTLFIYYKNDRLTSVFENFAKEGMLSKGDTLYKNIIKYAPPDINDNLNIQIPALGGASLSRILFHMSMEQLHFILHLRHAIEREEAAIKDSI